MTIEQKLLDLAETHRDANGCLTNTSHDLRQAAVHITNQERYIRSLKAELNDRFDRFFAAALQGILARSTAGDLMSGKAEMVNEARRVAKLCVQAQPGEDTNT